MFLIIFLWFYYRFCLFLNSRKMTQPPLRETLFRQVGSSHARTFLRGRWTTSSRKGLSDRQTFRGTCYALSYKKGSGIRKSHLPGKGSRRGNQPSLIMSMFPTFIKNTSVHDQINNNEDDKPKLNNFWSIQLIFLLWFYFIV